MERQEPGGEVMFHFTIRKDGVIVPHRGRGRKSLGGFAVNALLGVYPEHMDRAS